MTTKRAAAVLALWLCAAVAIFAAKIKTQTQFDPEFDFKTLKTWAWTPAGTGDVLIARSPDDDPKPIKARVDPVITAAVAKELGLAGFTQATGGTPDMAVHYYLLVTVGSSSQLMGQFLPNLPAWGVPPFMTATQSLEMITRGSIVLDLNATKIDHVVWRGVAQTDIDQAQSDAKRDAIIHDAAHELVKRIPLKKK
jgi:hypothetical protein